MLNLMRLLAMALFAAVLVEACGPTGGGVDVSADKPRIVQATLKNGIVGAPWRSIVNAVGGSGNYRWRLANGTLPPGAGGIESGTPVDAPFLTLTGIPTDAGEYIFRIVLTDIGGISVTRQFTVTISEEVAPQILQNSLPVARVGEYFQAELSVGGGVVGGSTDYEWAVGVDVGVTPPAGVSGFSNSPQIGSTVFLHGTPTTAGSWIVDIWVSDSVASVDHKRLKLTIENAPSVGDVKIAEESMDAGQVGSNYTFSLSATGGVGAYAWIIADGELPEGLAGLGFSPTETGGTATVSGTPTEPGEYSLWVFVFDDKGNSASRMYTLSIAP